MEGGEEATIITVCCPEHSNKRGVWCIFNMLCVIQVWREPSRRWQNERCRERARASGRARGADSVSLKESRRPLKEGGSLVALFFRLADVNMEEDRPRRTTPRGWRLAARSSAAACAAAPP